MAAGSLSGCAQMLQTHVPPGMAARPKGPLVFLDYDQEELDLAYDQDAWAPNSDEIGKRKAQKNEAALARFGEPQILRYGPSENETLELYPAREPNAPINVYFHGGAWRGGAARGEAYLSENFVDAGANYIAANFTNVVETGGDLRPMAEQVRRAILWIYRNASTFNSDPDRFYISAHSSGSHLVACALTSGWPGETNLPPDFIKGAVLSSGMYDLYAVSLSARANYVNLSVDIIEEFSPQRHLDKLRTPLICSNGSLETPEFKRQGQVFVAACDRVDIQVGYFIGEGYTHPEMAQTFADPYGILGRAALWQMGLGPGEGLKPA
jgi:arylformamidase